MGVLALDEIVGDDVAESPDHLVVAKDDFDLDNEDGGEIMEENQNQEMYENQEIADVPVMRGTDRRLSSDSRPFRRRAVAEEFTAQPEKKAKKDKYDNTFPAGALFFPWARVKKIIRERHLYPLLSLRDIRSVRPPRTIWNSPPCRGGHGGQDCFIRRYLLHGQGM